jgi:hypothetical protein
MSNILLESKVNYEYFAEIHKPIDPIQHIYNTSKTLEEIKTKLDDLTKLLNRRYPDYVDFYYTFNYTQPSNGCYEAWYNLYGVKKL